MSIRQLADQAEIGYRTLQDYVSGKTAPGAEQLSKIGRLGVSIDWILTGTIQSPFMAMAQETRVSVQIGDYEFLNDLYIRASILPDRAYSLFVEEFGRPCRFDEACMMAAIAFSEMASTSIRMADELDAMIASGLGCSQIARVVTRAFSPESEALIYVKALDRAKQ